MATFVRRAGVEDFVGCEPQDRAVHRVDPLRRVVIDHFGEGGVDGLLGGEHGIHQFIGAAAEFVQISALDSRMPREVRLLGKLLGLLDHAQAVGHALQAADARADGFQRTAQFREILERFEKPSAGRRPDRGRCGKTPPAPR